jgi:hypothetical protein
MSTDNIKENKSMFTEQQVLRAKASRQLYHTIGTPSLKDFKAIVTTNSIGNLPMTLDNIKLAEKVFGTYIGTLKGKTT